MTLPTASTLFLYESLIFSSQSSAHAVEHRTSKLRRGATMDGVQRLTVMINRKDYYGRNCNPHFWFRRGYFVEVRACANGFLQVFSPPGATSAEGGRGGSPPRHGPGNCTTKSELFCLTIGQLIAVRDHRFKRFCSTSYWDQSDVTI